MTAYDDRQTSPQVRQTVNEQRASSSSNNNPGYSVTNGRYSYDPRYGTYNKDVDYTAKMNQALKGGNNKAAAYYEAMANQKVQDLYANNPKYHTQNNYGSYLNQNSDDYLKYLSGQSADAYTLDAATASMLGNYDKTFQYSQAIKDAEKAGDYQKAAVYEYLMNQKIKNEGLPYIQTDNFSGYLNGITQSQVNMAKYGADVTPTGLYYKVQDNGKAPPGLNVGDYVVTGNGVWMITGLNDDGTYKSTAKVDGATNTSNFKGAYTTPNSVLQAQGMANIASKAEDTSEFTELPSVNSEDYTIKPVENFETPSITSDAKMQPLRSVYDPGAASMDDYGDTLAQLRDANLAQAFNQIDYATNTGVEEYQRAYEDALPTYAAQRGQVDLAGSQNAKNAALYAEQRGDRGGIGAAQYGAAQIAMANQLNQINTAQNKAALDTARSIADLRNKGEWEKADKLVEVNKDYMSKLMEAQQWVKTYNMQYAQLDQQLRKYENDYIAQWAELTGNLPDGSKSMAAKSSEAQLGVQYLPYVGGINGQPTVQVQEANAGIKSDLLNQFGNVDGQTGLTGKQYLDSRRLNWWNQTGIDPVTGLPSAAENERQFTNRMDIWGMTGYDPITGQGSADMLQWLKTYDHNVTMDGLNMALQYAQSGAIPPESVLQDAGITSDAGKTMIKGIASVAAQALRYGNLDASANGVSNIPFGMEGSVTLGGGVGTSSGSSTSSGGSSRGSGGGGGGNPVATNPTPTPAATDTSTSNDNASTIKAVKAAIDRKDYTIARNILTNAGASGKINSDGKNYSSLMKQITTGQAARDAKNTKKK